MMVGVLVAGTRSPTVRRPLSRKLSALEILLAPECKYLQQSRTNYNWFIMSLNHFVRCALKVSEPRLSALLKESLIISIIERIPDYQHCWKDPHYQHYWKDPQFSALLKGSPLSALLKVSPIISSHSRITPIPCWEQLLHIKLYSGRTQQCWVHA